MRLGSAFWQAVRETVERGSHDPGSRQAWDTVAVVRNWPDSEAPTARPASPLIEVDLPFRRSE